MVENAQNVDVMERNKKIVLLITFFGKFSLRKYFKANYPQHIF